LSLSGYRYVRGASIIALLHYRSVEQVALGRGVSIWIHQSGMGKVPGRFVVVLFSQELE
jgi:hypothetical protein